MKRQNIVRGLMAVILLLSVAQSLMAQEAFYIYRNDGDFNGFFYDQVKRMNMSKVDFDGVEHDDYVIQEVLTDDSLYRIPIVSIDSISFVQPEIIFNPSLKNMEETGLTPYIESIGLYGNEKVVYLRDDIPLELTPQVGDVLVSFDEAFLEPYGANSFSGKVRSIEHDPNYPILNIYCDLITDLGDIFVQFITVEQVTADESGKVRSRLAGYGSDDNPANTRGSSGSGSLMLIDDNLTLSKTFNPREGVEVSVNMGVDIKVKLQVAYNITWRRAYVNTMINTGVDINPSVGVKASTDFEFPIDGLPQFIKSIKFPAIAPLFQTRPFPEAFLRGGGEIEATITFPSSHFQWDQSFTLDTDLSGFPVRYSNEMNGPKKEDAGEDGTYLDLNSASVKLSGFVQTGIKNIINIETNDWAKDFLDLGIGVELYTGPKIRATLEYNTSLGNNPDENIYDNLKDSHIDASLCSVDVEAKARYKLLWDEEQESTFLEESIAFGELTLYLFPDFKPTKVDFSQQRQEATVMIRPCRRTFWLSKIGIALYNDKDELIDKFDFYHNYFMRDSLNLTTKFNTSGLPSGMYHVRPYLKTLGQEIPVNDATEYFVIAPMMEISEDEIRIDSKEQQVKILFGTNHESVHVTLYEEVPYNSYQEEITYREISGDSWASATITDIDVKEEYGEMIINVGKNPSVFPRRLEVVATSGTDLYTSSDTLFIYQAAGSDTFTRATIWFSMPGEMKDHSWGTRDGEPFDNSETREVSPGISGKRFENTEYSDGTGYKFTSTRNGDIITINCENYPQHVQFEDGELTSVETLELTVDVSKRPGRVLKGSYVNYFKRTASSSEEKVGGDKDDFTYWTTSESSNEELDEKWGWEHEITGYHSGYDYINYNGYLTADVWGSYSWHDYGRRYIRQDYKNGHTFTESFEGTVEGEYTPTPGAETGIEVRLWTEDE